MMLTEVTAVPEAVLPVQAMKDHLRLGTGFADDGLQDGLIAAHLRAAMAMIEARTGKALITREFSLRLDRWRPAGSGQTLPVAPVASVSSVTLGDAVGGLVVLAPQRWRLVRDMARPRLEGIGGLPVIAEGGFVEIVFEAGFGPVWADIPGDLAQAVLLLAAEFYERRHADDGRVLALPAVVQGLIERWRIVRLLGGAGI